MKTVSVCTNIAISNHLNTEIDLRADVDNELVGSNNLTLSANQTLPVPSDFVASGAVMIKPLLKKWVPKIKQLFLPGERLA